MAQRAGVEINDFPLFDRALTHASVVAECQETQHDYESLEFLGDAVLGLAVAHRLFALLPDRTPGEYSRLRAGLVNRRTVAHVARALDLAPAIRLGKGEEASGGRERAGLVSDCMEAFIGAVYLDSGWETAQAMVDRLFAVAVDEAIRQDRVWDFKSRLQNYCQAARVALPEFVVMRSEVPDHDKEFEVEVRLRGVAAGRGVGSTKKQAEQRAARAALEREGHRFD